MGVDNRIDLTTEGHALAHRLLFEKHGRWQDELAWKAISGRIGIEEIIFQKQSANGKMSKGRKHTPEAREKLRNIDKSYMKTKEYKEKMSGPGNGMYGKTQTPEARAKISEMAKGRPAWNKGIKEEREEIIIKLQENSKLRKRDKNGKYIKDETL